MSPHTPLESAHLITLELPTPLKSVPLIAEGVPSWDSVSNLTHYASGLVGIPSSLLCLRDSSLSNDFKLEQTIQHALDFRGVGLHSGVNVVMRLIPAPAGSGIVFRRSDLDNFEIPATGRNVAKVSYATSLMRQGVLISTTEHLLSALVGLGVDNIIVEIDNLEVPILDGSALPYVSAMLAVGLKPQRRKREYIRILKPIEVRENSSAGPKFIGVYPGEGYSIDYSIEFPAPIGRDTFSGDLEAGAYATLIAPARTFGFREDEAMLRDMGLIRGVSDESAIILTRGSDTQPGDIQNGPLRFPDEFVRHKVLDLIGDLALAGRRIWGRVVAERAGHAMHTALVQRLLRDRSAWKFAHRSEYRSEDAHLQKAERVRDVSAVILAA